MRTLFVLGSIDPEMTTIECLATEAGHVAIPAAGPTGARVRPGEAAVGLVGTDDAIAFARDFSRVVFVECDGERGGRLYVSLAMLADSGAPYIVKVVDHHGAHPSASAPPDLAVPASSLGQVIRLLVRSGWMPEWETSEVEPSADAEDGAIGRVGSRWGVNVVPPYEQWGYIALIPESIAGIAAADHCLAAAYAGRCGVDFSPGSVAYAEDMERTRQAFAPEMSAEEFEATVETCKRTLADAGGHDMLGCCVADLTGLAAAGPVTKTGERYPAAAQFLPRVAAIVGRPYIVRIGVAHGSGVAYRLGGFDGAIPEHRAAVERWLATGWAELGCYGPDDQSVPQTHRAYGVPARGFAGGTVRAYSELLDAWEPAKRAVIVAVRRMEEGHYHAPLVEAYEQARRELRELARQIETHPDASENS